MPFCCYALCSLAGIDQKMLSDLVAYLQIFVDASLELEAERTPTLHLAVPWYYKLKRHCNPAADDSNPMRAIKKSASDLLDEKFKFVLLTFEFAFLISYTITGLVYSIQI